MKILTLTDEELKIIKITLENFPRLFISCPPTGTYYTDEYMKDVEKLEKKLKELDYE